MRRGGLAVSRALVREHAGYTRPQTPAGDSGGAIPPQGEMGTVHGLLWRPSRAAAGVPLPGQAGMPGDQVCPVLGSLLPVPGTLQGWRVTKLASSQDVAELIQRDEVCRVSPVPGQALGRVAAPQGYSMPSVACHGLRSELCSTGTSSGAGPPVDAVVGGTRGCPAREGCRDCPRKPKPLFPSAGPWCGQRS